MSAEPYARQDLGVSSQEFVLPDLDPESVRRVRLCLAAWAACGVGTTRSWRMATLLSHGGVHVVVTMPTFDAPCADALGRLLDAVVRLQPVEQPVEPEVLPARQAA